VEFVEGKEVESECVLNESKQHEQDVLWSDEERGNGEFFGSENGHEQRFRNVVVEQKEEKRVELQVGIHCAMRGTIDHLQPRMARLQESEGAQPLAGGSCYASGTEGSLCDQLVCRA